MEKKIQCSLVSQDKNELFHNNIIGLKSVQEVHSLVVIKLPQNPMN